MEIAAHAQRHFFGRDRGRNRDDADVEQLETEQRPGDGPQPAGVVHGERLARAHRFDDRQQAAEHDMGDGDAHDADQHD